MSIPKNGQFHKHQAYVTRVYDVGKWIDNKYVGEHTVRLTSYQSIVADFIPSVNNSKNHVILYPRWQYSPSTIRQVTRFISECSGMWYSVDELRKLAKQQTNGLLPISGNCLFTFSNEYPRG